MEKIFDKKIQEYLKSAGVSEAEILKIQYDKIKEHVLHVLATVASLIEKESFDKIDKVVAYSPAGDEMGCDNYFIDFGEVLGDDSFDIIEVKDLLKRLKTDIAALQSKKK